MPLIMILIQIVLVVVWYVVPEAATMPWWVVFLPAEMSAIGVFITLVIGWTFYRLTH